MLKFRIQVETETRFALTVVVVGGAGHLLALRAKVYPIASTPPRRARACSSLPTGLAGAGQQSRAEAPRYEGRGGAKPTADSMATVAGGIGMRGC